MPHFITSWLCYEMVQWTWTIYLSILSSLNHSFDINESMSIARLKPQSCSLWMSSLSISLYSKYIGNSNENAYRNCQEMNILLQNILHSIVILFELFSNQIVQLSMQFNWTLMHFLALFLLFHPMSSIILGFFHLIPFIIQFVYAVHCAHFHIALFSSISWLRRLSAIFHRNAKNVYCVCCIYWSYISTVTSIIARDNGNNLTINGDTLLDSAHI